MRFKTPSFLLLLAMAAGVLFSVLFGFSSSPAQADRVLPQEYAPGELVVQLTNDAFSKARMHGKKFGLSSLDELAANYGATNVTSIAPKSPDKNMRRIVRLRLPESTNIPQAIRDFQKNDFVDFVEPNAILRAHFTPNDPSFASKQWNFTKVGAESAWDFDATSPAYGGDSSVVVAVIDTGVAYEDSGSFAKASDFASTNFVAGYDYVSNDTHPNDDNGHGTHVAGTIAESANNGLLAAGLAFNTSIMPIKVLNSTGSGLLTDVASGIDFARSNGADVINMSLGSDTGLAALETAINNAVNAGVLVVASTGNDGRNTIAYPARYSNVIAVGATTSTDGIAGFSNRGEGIDLVAPGGGGSDYIYQQTFNNLDAQGHPRDYTSFGLMGYQGTSQAAPHVSAGAALLLAYGVTSSNVLSVLTSTATDIETAGYDTSSGYGRLNLSGAFELASGDFTAPSNPTVQGYTDSNQATAVSSGSRQRSLTPYFTWSGATDSQSAIEGYYVYFGKNGSLDPKVYGTFQTTALYQGSVEAGDDVPYYLRIKSRDAAGNSPSEAVQFEYRIDTFASPASNLAASNSQSGVQLTWTANDSHSAQTIIARAELTGGFANHLNTTTGTSYTDGSLGEGRTGYYVVATVDDLGNIAAYSNEAAKTFYRQEAIAAGAGVGGAPQVSLFRPDGTVIRRFYAASSSLRCGVNVTVGDLDGDGTNEIVTGLGDGCAPQVRVFDQQGRSKFTNGFDAYASNIRNGVFVAVGNLDGDGNAEIITGTGPKSGPHVRVFDRFGKARFPGFFPYDSKFRGGVFVATGDLNGDGKDEIVTGVGMGGGSHVRTFNALGQAVFTPGFFAFANGYNGGVRVGTGDFNGDGKEDIVAGAGPVGAPQVRLFDFLGKSIVTSGWNAYASDFRGGIFVDGADTDQDGTSEVITSVGGSGSPLVRVFEPNGSRINSEFKALADSFKNGVNIAGGRLD